ncbi:MAG: transposase [Planctomycetota bacterium]
MGQRRRHDEPGAYHHVVHRGISRRPLFEGRSEGRYFLAQLAKRVRAGQLEVVAYSLMTTHFHLPVRSPTGELSEAMRKITNAYSRLFNRRHRRDGPLFRGRYTSRRIDTLSYRVAVLRYIDLNPVQARIVSQPSMYALGSARRLCSAAPGPWLSLSWLRPFIDEMVEGDQPWPSKYRAFAGRRVPEGLRELVEARLGHNGEAADLLDEPVNAAPPRILDWMERKTRLADRSRLLLPIAGVSAIRKAVAAERESLGATTEGQRSNAPDPASVLRAALLRKLAGQSLETIAYDLGVTEMTARRYIRLHERMTQGERGGYLAIAERVAQCAVTESTRDLRPA